MKHKAVRIDPVTGLAVEDVVFPTDENGNLIVPSGDPQYIFEDAPDGLIHPRWDGIRWVEGKPDEARKHLRGLIKRTVHTLRQIEKSQKVTLLGHSFDADEESIANITGMISAINAGIPAPSPILWRSADNAAVEMTLDQLKQLAGKMVQQVDKAYRDSWSRKDHAQSLNTPEELRQYLTDLESSLSS